MDIAYFGNDIFIDCFRYLADSDRFRVLKLFSVEYGGQDFDLARSTRLFARERGIPVQTEPALPRDLDALRRSGCEAIISAGYSHKIPPWAGGAIRYAVNIHPSLLPRGAGPMPLPWAILKGLKRTGVTLHKLDGTWDGGDILLQESFPLTGGESIEELLVRSQRLSLSLLDCFLGTPEAYWQRAVPQPRCDREYWPRLTPRDCEIDWTWELEKIARYLRIYRHASPDGTVEYITDVGTSRMQHSHVPGAVLRVDTERRFIATKEGVVSFRVRRKPAG